MVLVKHVRPFISVLFIQFNIHVFSVYFFKIFQRVYKLVNIVIGHIEIYSMLVLHKGDSTEFCRLTKNRIIDKSDRPWAHA